LDGCLPLITNDTVMTPAETLAAYKYQPNLERRHGQLKGHQLVAPVLLKDPVRIEGLLCCHFFALVVQALIEREIRAAMLKAGARHIPLYYPQFSFGWSPTPDCMRAATAGRLRASEDGPQQVLIRLLITR
jgi:hypothetical protein